MEHLKTLLSFSSAGRTCTPSPADRSRRLRATLSSVARSVKSNFVDTLARKAKKRAPPNSPFLCTPPPKRRRSPVAASSYAVSTPSQSSTVSSLTQSSSQDTNHAIQEVLFGCTEPTNLDVGSTTLLSTSNLGLRRLLVPDILALQDEDRIVLVLSKSSRLFPLYKGAILQHIRLNNRTLLQNSRLQLANATLQGRHEIQRLGSSLYEFRATVVSYPKRHLLYDDAIDESTLRRWVGQGEGFTVEFIDYPGQTAVVKWKDLQDTSSLEIWRLATRDDTLPPILFGCPHSMEAKCEA
jgi:hypothetical protein